MATAPAPIPLADPNDILACVERLMQTNDAATAAEMVDELVDYAMGRPVPPPTLDLTPTGWEPFRRLYAEPAQALWRAAMWSDDQENARGVAPSQARVFPVRAVATALHQLRKRIEAIALDLEGEEDDMDALPPNARETVRLVQDELRRVADGLFPAAGVLPPAPTAPNAPCPECGSADWKGDAYGWHLWHEPTCVSMARPYPTRVDEAV